VQQLKEFWNKLRALISEKDIFFNASAITFNLIICAIPFTLILISIIGYILSYEEAYSEILGYAGDLIPQITSETGDAEVILGEETLQDILNPLIGARTVFGITGLLILVIFTQGLFHGFKHIIFDVFDITDRKHPIMDVIYNFLGFGVLGSVFIFFSLFISLTSLFDLSLIHIPYTDIYIRLPWIYDFLDFLLPIVLTFILIYVVFRFVSERRISTRTSLIGASIYTFLFEIAKMIVGYYMGYAFSTYKYFYQGYAIFVIIGFWAFYSSLLFVISVIITRAFKETYFVDESMVDENPYAALD
jgi:uncharacterized BrkB/YihY/UPF0761 family membrane protein